MKPSASTPQLLRRTNLTAVLKVMRDSPALTGSDLITATGLTRATVIALCDDLIRRGWVRELDSQRDTTGPQQGRPARRFEFNDRAGAVLGIDVGAGKTSILVADLRGTTVAQATEAFSGPDIGTAERLETINRAALRALESAGLPASAVLAAGIGIAAAVDRRGNIPHSQPFWESFDVGLQSEMLERHGWPVLLENDANLAALGERWRGAGAEDLAVMLAGERLGTGLIESGRLLHGSRGGAGEMAYLTMVEGVGSAHGIAALARIWGTEALAPGAPATALRELAGGGGVTAELVFAAAAGGDGVARAILARIAARLSRVIASLGTIFNPELVVIGGAVAGSAGVLLEAIESRLPEFTATPPRVAVSALGDMIVSVGAVRLALDYVEQHALDLHPASPDASSATGAKPAE